MNVSEHDTRQSDSCQKTLFRQQILITLRQFEAVVEVSLHRSITKYSNKVTIKTVVCDLWQIKKNLPRKSKKKTSKLVIYKLHLL